MLTLLGLIFVSVRQSFQMVICSPRGCCGKSDLALANAIVSDLHMM